MSGGECSREGEEIVGANTIEGVVIAARADCAERDRYSGEDPGHDEEGRIDPLAAGAPEVGGDGGGEGEEGDAGDEKLVSVWSEKVIVSLLHYVCPVSDEADRCSET